ncbi:Histone-lysine N-methyltransferase SMYD3 [Cytospora mali]|uniref:Histone-lysine N-methyltransferase SMYD3 n=1 Tax=Cytospora mali TaxID=578113 RepID=A0A194W3C1_CYTMA|nr:Histone-lysine N-methyltransferase SMYD3 [Valsa mali]
MAPPAPPACSNEGPKRLSPCDKDATLECSSCHLVKYCSKECQTSHWPVHKKDCKSELLKSTWRPSWEREGRTPTFMADGLPPFVPFGRAKFLWGNMPALDILKLQENEGVAYNKPLNLLFAASGDLRNVVKTITSLPEGFSSGLNIDINDRDMDIVARNIIFLLLCYTIDDGEEAAECVLHLWYSTLIPEKCLQKLDILENLIGDVCSKIKTKPAHTILGRTWTFAQGKGSVRVVLIKEMWEALLSYLKVPEGLTADRAEKVRSTIMNAPQRVDNIHRYLFTQMKPTWRICTHKFRQDGILLPFGHPRNQHTLPNPTFFQTADEWPMKDSADPFHGWPLSEVFNIRTGAKDDVNGKLYQYVRSTLADFHSRLRALDVNFQLFQGDVQGVVPLLLDASVRYDRIEVSNICDFNYLGIKETLALFGPRLRLQESHPHATLITLFLNAVDREASSNDVIQEMVQEMAKLTKYLPLPMLSDENVRNAELLRFSEAKIMVRDVDKFFNRHMKRLDFLGAGKAAGLSMKQKNTIVDEWPMRLKLRPQQKGAKEEFEQRLGSGHTGVERYVEWQRSS